MNAVSLVIIGRVQGVSFRYFIREKAIQLQLAGWVRNRTNGNVEAFFQGEQQSIDQMIAYCQTGPPLANVIKTEVREETPHTSLSYFRVLTTY